MKEEMKTEMAMDKREEDKKPDFSLDIKYNGQEMSLDEEKARELAQKGMNYDHVLQELERLRSDTARQKLEELSKNAGMEAQELLDMLLNEGEPQPTAQNQREDEELRKLIGFFENHPQIGKFSDLPDEVKEKVLSGGDPEETYLEYENRLLKSRLCEIENGNKTPGALHFEGEALDDDAFASMLTAKI